MPVRPLRRAVSLAVLACLVSSVGVAAREAPAEAEKMIAALGLKESATAARDLPGWRVPKRIVVAGIPAGELAPFQAVAPGVELVVAAEGEARKAQLAQADAVIGLCDAETLAAAPKLHWIQALNVGVERCVSVPGVKERGLLLTNMQRTSGAPIAEHAIAMLLSLTRQLPEAVRQAGHWNREAVTARPMIEVGGRTLLVVGLGGIGTEVARRAHGLGMRVIATRNSSREGPDF